MNELFSFRTYASSAAAQPLLDLLDQQRIPYKTHIDSGQPAFDPSFACNAPYAQLVVRLRPADVALAERLEAELNARLIQQVAPDHYLLAFSEQELLEVVAEPASWSSFDVALATQLLQKRDCVATAAPRPEPPPAPRPPARGRMRGWVIVGRILLALIGLVALFRACRTLLE